MSSKYKLLWNRGESSLSSILTIFIFIVVVAIALWGAVNAVKFAPRLYDIISSPFSRTSALAITAPTEAVKDGDALSITWSHRTEASGQYAFRYDCVDGTHFEAPVAEGGVYGAITCNIPYGVPATERAIRVIPHNKNTASTSVPFTLTFTDGEGAVVTEAQGNVTILPGTTTSGTAAAPTATATNTNTEPAPASAAPKPAPVKPAATTSTGPADLVITFLSIDAASPGYAPYGQFNEGDVVNIRFDIKNQGARATGPWSFSANLPAGNGYYYTSPVQRSLNPQDGAVYTLTFTMPQSGTLTIDVDPANTVTESSEYNNTLVRTLDAYANYGAYPVYENTYQYPTYQDQYYDYQNTYNYVDPYSYPSEWQYVGW